MITVLVGKLERQIDSLQKENESLREQLALWRKMVTETEAYKQAPIMGDQLAARVPDSTYESVCSKIVGRYVVEKRTGGGFWPYCVRAVGGSMELFIGQKNKCDEVAQALQTACLDGAFMMKESVAPQPVAQECEWTNCPRRVGDVCCNEQPAVQGEPVAWMVYQGVCQYQLCGSEKHAKAVAAQNQKDHDLSGSLAHFHVKPLYTHPQP